jgi:hypothetical protein
MKFKLISRPINWQTAAIPAPKADPPVDYCAERTAMPPTRRRRCAQNRARRITTRTPTHNHRIRPPHTDDDLPPF